MANFSLTDRYFFVSQSVLVSGGVFYTNLKQSKLPTFENSSYIQHEKRDFSKSSNPRE
jgi:hypothetical protein